MTAWIRPQMVRNYREEAKTPKDTNVVCFWHGNVYSYLRNWGNVEL